MIFVASCEDRNLSALLPGKLSLLVVISTARINVCVFWWLTGLRRIAWEHLMAAGRGTVLRGHRTLPRPGSTTSVWPTWSAAFSVRYHWKAGSMEMCLWTSIENIRHCVLLYCIRTLETCHYRTSSCKVRVKLSRWNGEMWGLNGVFFEAYCCCRCQKISKWILEFSVFQFLFMCILVV